MDIIAQHKKEIVALCEKHSVLSLSLFGSMASGEATESSDVDMLVTFGEIDLHHYADNYYDLVLALENLLGRKVDLLTEKSISNPYLLKSINRHRIKLYERTNPRLAA
jgi:predicted nucleotidyltransferase